MADRPIHIAFKAAYYSSLGFRPHAFGDIRTPCGHKGQQFYNYPSILGIDEKMIKELSEEELFAKVFEPNHVFYYQKFGGSHINCQSCIVLSEYFLESGICKFNKGLYFVGRNKNRDKIIRTALVKFNLTKPQRGSAAEYLYPEFKKHVENAVELERQRMQLYNIAWDEDYSDDEDYYDY